MHLLLIPFPPMVLKNLAASSVAGRFFVPLGTCHWICWDFEVEAETPSISYKELSSAWAVKPRDDDNVSARLCKNIF